MLKSIFWCILVFNKKKNIRDSFRKMIKREVDHQSYAIIYEKLL